ncbi:uncharacterized protein MICPUCDRAFT_66099 [Micromonas pusilla CCMP1545]|uniref:Predicted protein n=1 Tax=Micromonas pusilla (strain CCMP1545) TaxID=564608 RepID=C1NAJ5_MICPC|nr:uncharacterized protein MICPUCDRAFT_66099 [Micromonas pusilla CCMP1545]EEH50950.1 predicted protein [Micromonas pusilla CCMP1545]|eukprot:XP_003064970.1 predicted protein [Micromonas pusilla CCMP1545]
MGSTRSLVRRGTFLGYSFLAACLICLYVFFRQGTGSKINTPDLRVVVKTTYRPSALEQYIMDGRKTFGYILFNDDYASGCEVWKSPPSEIADILTAFAEELKSYSAWADSFESFDLKTDLRTHRAADRGRVCNRLQPAIGLNQTFQSGALSCTSSGYLEPILPPMRHPEFCFDGNLLMSTKYLVHDFPALCSRLSANSRTVFVDLGASLVFHADGEQPTLSLIKLYQKFGFYFDHIYAYEITPGNATELYESLPAEWLASYHWINAGIETDPTSALNPLRMLIENYEPGDLVVLKIDVDNPEVELSIINQILTNEALHGLIDQLYFEHHVLLEELRVPWGPSVRGSVSDSLILFHELRSQGISAHFWV